MTKSLNLAQAGLSINPVLSGIVQGYTNAEFVGSALFPDVPTPARHGQVLQFGKEAFKLYQLERAPGAAITQIDVGFAGIPFSLKQVAAKIPLPRETTDEAKVIAGVDLPMFAIQTQMDIILLNQEVSQANLATAPASYNGNSIYAPTGAAKWSDPASDPQRDVLAAREVVRKQIGRYPNTMVISASVFAALETHPKIIDRIKYTTSASVDTAMLANLFKVKTVVVAEGVYADDADNMFDIWGKNAVLAFVPDAASGKSLARPSFGYNYVLEGYPAVQNAYLDPNVNSWIYTVFYERNAFITSKDSGFLFQNVVA